MTRATLFHIVAQTEWDRALRVGTYAPVSLETQGFVHLSEAGQVASVANQWYPDGADLIVVELDPDRLEARIVDEDTYDGGQLFPHLYGPVPVSAAIAVHPLPRDADGKFYFPAG